MSTENPLETSAKSSRSAQGRLSRRLEEHGLVRTLEPVSEGEIRVPGGTLGTVVFVHEKDDAFEVEFAAPFDAVVSVCRRQIETV